MAMRIKPLPDRPELTELIKKSVEQVKTMTPRQRAAMIRAQRKSWARQDRD